jgi:hypothetical protein
VGITSEEIHEAWQVLCSVYDSRGIDLRKLLNAATKSKPEWLSTRRYRADFEKLHNAGCSEVALLIALWIIRSAPSWSNTWRVVVGGKRDRSQLISALEKAASALEDLQNSFDVVLSRQKKLASPATVPSRASDSQLTSQIPDVELSPIPAPHAIIGALKTYSRVLKGFNEVAKRTKINSPEAFGRYLISELVKTATGEYHDKEVSALIGGAVGEARYDEVAHRNWRFRNYKHIQAVSFPVEFLIGFSLIIALDA